MRIKIEEKHCQVCGATLDRKNTSGLCGNHYKKELRAPRKKPKVIYARCWNKYCGRRFRLQKNQHPKYSFCPECKKLQGRINFNCIIEGGYMEGRRMVGRNK